jgi:hypothetical protein
MVDLNPRLTVQGSALFVNHFAKAKAGRKVHTAEKTLAWIAKKQRKPFQNNDLRKTDCH